VLQEWDSVFIDFGESLHFNKVNNFNSKVSISIVIIVIYLCLNVREEETRVDFPKSSALYFTTCAANLSMAYDRATTAILFSELRALISVQI
jgi:hypothetical protein